MNEGLQRIVLGVATTFLAGFGGCWGTGCALLPTNLGEIGVRTSWAVYHEARKPEGGEDVKASLELEAPTLLEWLTGPDKPEKVEP